MESISSPMDSPSQAEDGTMLTPRTKVARMLADIEDAPTPSPTRPPASGRQEDSSKSTDSIPQPFLEESGTDEDGDIVKPQGRAARRMLNKRLESSPIPSRQHAMDDSEEDLYSATPRIQASSRPRNDQSPSRISLNHSPTGSPLFVSPARPTGDGSDEEDDLPRNPFGTKQKLQGLIAKKRAERLAKEARGKEARDASSDPPEEESQADAYDADVEKILSDASRPARKASKRALLEMERETQRMSRQQALAHQMRVKKKFTTSDLFAKFNFRQAAGRHHEENDVAEEGTSGSSAPNSDGLEEASRHPVSTPPSSPPTPLDRQKALVERGALSKLVPVREDSLASLGQLDSNEELPDIEDVLRSSQRPIVADDPDLVETRKEKPGLKLARFGKKAVALKDDDSDEELEILPSLPSHLQAIEKALKTTRQGRPADSRAIHALKQLSHLPSRETRAPKKGARPSVDPKTLEAQLRRRAKEQARQQQLERIDDLRARGIVVQTTDDREKEAEVFEDLLEKARQDAVDLRKAEKTARKAAGEEVGEASDDEDEDVDYVGSGSEEEEVVEADHGEEPDEDGLIDEAAAEESAEEEDESENGEDVFALDQKAGDELDDIDVDAKSNHIGGVTEVTSPIKRKVRQKRIILDEDDDEDNPKPADVIPATQSRTPAVDPFAAFNFGGANQGLSLMSPTQAFNATMQTPTQLTQDDSYDMLRRIAPPSSASLPPTLPDLDTQFDNESQPSFIAGSQVPESQRVDFNWETQAPETPSAANKALPSLEDTPGWEPTQDGGLPSPWTIPPRLSRDDTLDSIVEQDTQSTVRLRVSESPAPSQTAPRKGRLGKRRLLVADDSDDEDVVPPATLKPKQMDAFREMAKRRKEALTALEKADVTKEMRQMMDEQAEESEDEYAGLGGDDFVAPETEQDREMIDSSHVDVDERALAAHFAERERLREEQETSKLYKDLTTGGLRRKMGAHAFDLDEDEDEIAARRRQMRQMEEAKKRRALLKDDNIASLAHGKQSRGKDAFLKAIADDDGDHESFDVADEDPALNTQDESTQSQSQQPAVEPLQETSGNKRKQGDSEDSQHDRPPAKQRRTQASEFRKPTSMLEVRESVSFLLEEPHAAPVFGPSTLDDASDSEDEYGTVDLEEPEDDTEVDVERARENDGGFAPDIEIQSKMMPPPRLPASQRRTAPKPAVVDRLSLKRHASSDSESAHNRTAWASGPATGGFKVPSLLRRATTNTGATGGNSRGVTTSNLSRENSGVKMGGSKKSSLAYQARAEERKAIVDASVRRREENTARVAQMRRNSSVLSKGLAGRFE